MNETTVNIVVPSVTRGRYGLDPSGRVLLEGDRVEALIGGRWLPFRVGNSHYYSGASAYGLYCLPCDALPQIGQYLIDENGNFCGLCLGMKVRYPGRKGISHDELH